MEAAHRSGDTNELSRLFNLAVAVSIEVIPTAWVSWALEASLETTPLQIDTAVRLTTYVRCLQSSCLF